MGRNSKHLYWCLLPVYKHYAITSYKQEYLVVKQFETLVRWIPQADGDNQGWAYALHLESGLFNRNRIICVCFFC